MSFAPRADIGDVVLLIDGQSGPIGLFDVSHRESIPLLGQHGAVVIWSDAGAAPAGYALDSAAGSGHIAAGGQSAKISPAALALSINGINLAQLRFRLKVIGSLGGPPVSGDLDLLAFAPPAVQRWTLNNVANGVLNVSGQVPDPGDPALLPAQGANVAVPAAYPSEDAWEAAAHSELFVYGNQGPAFIIVNNGSAATSGGAVAVKVSGHRLVIRPVSDRGGIQRVFMGEQITLPSGVSWKEIIKIPVSANLGV